MGLTVEKMLLPRYHSMANTMFSSGSVEEADIEALSHVQWWGTKAAG